MKGEQHHPQKQPQQDSSDGYAAASQKNQDYQRTIDRNPDHLQRGQSAKEFWRQKQQEHNGLGSRAGALAGTISAGGGGGYPVGVGGNQNGNYCQYDSYQVYNDDDDVWLSEERLFEHHLEEIFNKWRLLDDDIWCKLIIMERNRRIGKAYARVPIVTIDGSPELSYDGYKLALNGFDNPHRDSKTEDCRKRIGKGIRIKMDNFGNILIKRLTKAGVFIKEWIRSGPNGPIMKLNKGRLMPSRQQLIKNHCSQQQHALFNNNRPPLGPMQAIYSTNSLGPAGRLSGGAVGCDGSSSLEVSSVLPNDSSICDEIIYICGRLEQDKIYVIFDMKKFQANISQELCYPHPDKRKLERQCFSIIGLVRDATDILSLPCWVMVINIVAIEMLNERFSQAAMQTTFPDTMLMSDLDQSRPIQPTQSHQDYTTIYSNNSGSSSGSNSSSGINTKSNNTSNSADNIAKDKSSIISIIGKLEDPYTLPADASSSDIKSSYATALGKNSNSSSSRATPLDSNSDLQASRNPSCYYGSIISDGGPNGLRTGSPAAVNGAECGGVGRRSKSSCNIRSQGVKVGTAQYKSSRYDRSGGSIYSPGHMLLQTGLPPKLPPRDFYNKTRTTPSRSSATHGVDGAVEPQIDYNSNHGDSIIEPRKIRKNKFLGSLKMPPLNMIKSSLQSSSTVGDSATTAISTDVPISGSLMDSKSAVSNSNSNNNNNDNNNDVDSEPTKVASSKSNIKNLKLLLIGSSTKSGSGDGDANTSRSRGIKSTKDRVSDDSDYNQVGEKKLEGTNYNEEEACSVVDSPELLDMATCRQVASSKDWPADFYHGLDIPTPDYEFDENIYAFGHEVSATYRGFTLLSVKNDANQHLPRPAMLSGRGGNTRSIHRGSNTNYNSNKEDLYHSGLRAHVPHNIGTSSRSSRMEKHLAVEDEMVSAGGFGCKGDFYAGVNNRLAANNTRRMNYNSATIGSRYRSASMQRYQPQVSHLEPAVDMPDFSSHYGTSRKSTTLGRLHNNYASASIRHNHQAQYGTGSSIMNSSHTMGRSSSGIYNSSSSSSDYVDWNPQMRKFSSGGYLNSIFKSHNNLQTRHNSMRPMTNPLNSGSTNYINDKNDNNNRTTTISHEGYVNSLSRQARNKQPARNRLNSGSTLIRRSNQPMANSMTISSSYRSFAALQDEPAKSNYIIPSRWQVA